MSKMVTIYDIWKECPKCLSHKSHCYEDTRVIDRSPFLTDAEESFITIRTFTCYTCQTCKYRWKE